MKRLLFLLLAGALLLPGCTRGLRTEKLFLNEEIPFREGSENKLDLQLDIEFPVSGFDKDVLETLRRNIRIHTLGDSYASFEGSLDELAREFRDAQVEDYLTENQDLLKELGIPEEECFNLNWATDIRGSFGDSWGDWTVYEVERYLYLGGAHGVNSTTPVVFDRNTGFAATWDQVARGVSDEKITRLINQHKYDALQEIIDENDINKSDIFYVDPIEPSDWFSVNDDGLTFYYQPYEVAPYVFGVIEITVPWTDLR